MAPEVADGTARAASTASDVWALGVLLWEMLSGAPPFAGSGAVEIMRRIVNEEPVWPTRSRGDGDLLTIARRCLEKNPTRRPVSAGEVADELDRWLRGEPIKARPVTSGERFAFLPFLYDDEGALLRERNAHLNVDPELQQYRASGG